MVSILMFIVLILISFYIALIYSSQALAFLSVMLVLFWVFALAWIIHLRCMLRCRISIPIAATDVGKPVTVVLDVENRSPFMCPRMRVCLGVTDRFCGRTKKRWLKASGLPSQRSRIEFSLLLPEAGSYEISLKRIRVYDLTGLLNIGFAGRSRADVQILPDMQAVSVRLTEPVRNFFGEADVYDESKAGPDNSEIFQIRPFAAGDKLQSIHWKLSARMDELMVKENSLPKACAVVLFLDYRRQKKISAGIGAFLKIAASLSFSLMDAGCPHYVAWYEEQAKDIVRIRVDDEESFYLFLNLYIKDQGDRVYGDLAQLYREKYSAEYYMYGISLTEKLELLKNGSMFRSLQEAGLERQLEDLELIL